MKDYEVKEHSLSYVVKPSKPWNLGVFTQDFELNITSLTPDEIKFDLINADCTFANAIRRIIMDEVSSVAIERVYLRQNTSVIPDEVLAHRLGMVPLNVDPEHLAFCTSDLPGSDDLSGFDSNSHLIFDIKIKSQPKNTKAVNEEEKSSIPVYSSCLTWVPLPGQEDIFAKTHKPAPVFSDILLDKLNPEDEIIARCVAVRGVGIDHAKFNPVSVASYSLFPSFRLNKEVSGRLALKLQKCFPKGVIEVDPVTKTASIGDPRLDDGTRMYLRDSELKDLLTVTLLSSHLQFTVETCSPLYRPPETIVMSALDIMVSKCEYYLAIAEQPGFAETPVSNSDIQIALAEQESSGSNSTLNGRPAGLYVQSVSSNLLSANFVFKGEDHTLGTALRFCIFKSEMTNICGYNQPHPLENHIKFMIHSKQEPAGVVLRENLKTLKACFEHIKRRFKSSVRKYQKFPSSSDS